MRRWGGSPSHECMHDATGAGAMDAGGGGGSGKAGGTTRGGAVPRSPILESGAGPGAIASPERVPHLAARPRTRQAASPHARGPGGASEQDRRSGDARANGLIPPDRYRVGIMTAMRLHVQAPASACRVGHRRTRRVFKPQTALEIEHEQDGSRTAGNRVEPHGSQDEAYKAKKAQEFPPQVQGQDEA